MTNITGTLQSPRLNVIARIHTDFSSKFGIPRQSGIVESLEATIVFEPAYRTVDALRGLEGFSYIWLIWEFSETARETWSPTVRPPRLGGKKRMGVFATRSPFRPNPIGLSSVKLAGLEIHPRLGPILHITGADLMDNTPIYDIKPYIPFADSHPEATEGFAEITQSHVLQVEFCESLLNLIPINKREALLGVLANDPRPSYQHDPKRVYGLNFADFNIRFTVGKGTVTVCDVKQLV